MARALALALVAVALLAAGCGGNGDENGEATTTQAEGTTLQLAADPNGALSFDKDTLDAPAGAVTIELTNESSVGHNVEVEGNGVEEQSDTITDDTTSLTVDLEPGTYEFYCAVPGHREAGMEGTLTVS
jgi:plastocyanin